MEPSAPAARPVTSSPLRLLLRGVRRFVPRHFEKALRNFHTLATSYGQLESMRRWSCVDGEGKAIPWYTYPAIEYLRQLDFSERKVFEYGSGNSSIWWASRCRQLVSIESDEKWYGEIRAATQATTNFEYRLSADPATYVAHEDIQGADVIVIDGILRPDCADFVLAQVAAGKLAPDLLVFDNADWYPATVKRLGTALAGWIRVDFAGFGPINEYTWTTSIFFSPRAAGLAFRSPPTSVAGLKQVAEDDR